MHGRSLNWIAPQLVVTAFVLMNAATAVGQVPAENGVQTMAGVGTTAENDTMGPNAGKLSLIPPVPAGDAGPNTGSLHFNVGVDCTNSYFFRGIRQERGAFIVQPYGSVTVDLVQRDTWKLQATGGTWNSFHDTATNAASTDGFEKKWYESDVAAGLTLNEGKWTLAGQYVWETSPAGAFQTVEEVDLQISFDDSEPLGKWKLSPSLLLAVETGAHSADVASSHRGVYLQPSISPSFDADLPVVGKTSIAFPIAVGLSLSNYYQDASGKDSTFGYIDL